MLEDVKTSIGKLISLYETEKQRADQLSAELEQSREQLKACKDKIAELDSQIDNMKLQFAFSGSGDPALAKERITKLVREIDRCIKLLEN